MATTKITQSGIDFYYDNLRNVGAALTGVFTNQNNKENGKYYYDEDATKSIMALDIDWCGAKPGMTEGANGITTTGELLGIIKDYADTKSASNHTHPITLATDSGTSSINLLANTTYKLTAGGKSIIFKTPVDNSGSSTVASSDTLGLIKIGYATSGNNRAVILDSNNKAYVDTSHNHDLKIETTTNSTSVTLAHDTAYKLTAGGKEYNFKTPANYVHPTKSTTQFTAPDGKYVKSITLDSTGHIDAVTYATIPTPEIYANDLRVSETNNFESPTPITSLTLAPGESKTVYVKTFPYYGGEKATTEGKVVYGTSSNDSYIIVERLSGEEVLQGQNMVVSNNVFKITAKDTITSTINNLKAYFRLKYNYGVSNEVTITVQPAAEPQLTLSSTSGSIIRPKGSLSSISANGGSDNITVTVGSTANITAPTSLTLTYGANTNKTASTPTATYNGASVTPTWTSSDTSVATVSGTTITAKAAGSATLTATYNGKTATYSLNVTNESTSGSVTSGWTYTSDDTSIATISGTEVTGVVQGTTNIKVNYSGKTCNLSGTVTVNAAAPVNNYYWYVGLTQPTAANYESIGTTVSSYNSSYEYTPESRGYVYVLVKDDKNVTIIDPTLNATIDTDVDTSISGYKVYTSAIKLSDRIIINVG